MSSTARPPSKSKTQKYYNLHRLFEKKRNLASQECDINDFSKKKKESDSNGIRI